MTDDRDDTGYWNALADRVAAGAVRAPAPGTFEWLAESRTARVIALVLASLGVASMALPANPINADSPSVLAPADRMVQMMADPDRPPAIGVLLVESMSQRPR